MPAIAKNMSNIKYHRITTFADILYKYVAFRYVTKLSMTECLHFLKER